MVYDPTPATPTNIAPADNTTFPETTTQVTLSWSDPQAPDPTHPATYSVRVTDHTDPDVRHAGNNCPANKQYVCRDGLAQASLIINVARNHAYSWSVTKRIKFTYQVGNPPQTRTTFVSGRKATGAFRIGECDAAQILSVAAPEIMIGGATEYAYVLVRNLGTKTWTPQTGYKLGSISSPNNSEWGTNRAEMNTGSIIRPGQNASFAWPLHAPQTPKKYEFQWRMVREGVYWFGEKTTRRYLRVDAPVNPAPVVDPMWVKRDLRSGSLKRPPGDFIILRGGNYHVFEKDGKAQRKIVNSSGNIITKQYVDKLPCPGSLEASSLESWPGQPWTELFTTLSSNDINLLRVFLMNGFGIKDPDLNSNTPNEVADELYPYKLTNTQPRKWQVKVATTNPTVDANWNQAYFARLRAFAEQARTRWVHLQLALFNYYEMDNDAWGLSIWNPDRSDDLNWGKNNLVNPHHPNHPFSCSTSSSLPDEALRHCFFIETPGWSGLRNVQEQFVGKVVRTLRGLPNIILEVMNEPHGGSQNASAKFASTVIGWIIDEGKKTSPQWRPLISVDAFRQGLDPADPDRSDVDWWSDPASNPIGANHVDNYEEVDIVSYHGLSGPTPPVLPFKCNPNQAAPDYQTFYRTDLNSIRTRLETFLKRHPSKALMMSTDAVRYPDYYHWNDPKRIDLPDGQITSNLNHLGASDYDQMTRADLNDWAYWCFTFANQGTVIHFQNHSNYEATYAAINTAYRSSL